MIKTIMRPLFNQICEILIDTITTDECEIYFDINLPTKFCGKKSNDVLTFGRFDKIFAAYMFSFNPNTTCIGLYLYMSVDISEDDAYHVLRGLLLDYIKISSNRENIRTKNLNFYIENMKGFYIIPRECIKQIPSENFYNDVDKYMVAV